MMEVVTSLAQLLGGIGLFFVGTTLTSALATIGGSSATRRTGYSRVVHNCMTAIMALFLLKPFTEAVAARGPQFALVLFHTCFNVLGALAILPFTRRFAA
ncbi:MAG: hypothetical protein ACYTHK_06785 [Planctomycetota bacterium]|jgi:phosphate:Na+ symporter